MLHAAAGSRIITNELGTVIQGATVGGTARYVRDELEANGLYLRDGESAILLVSCDLGGLEPAITRDICEAIATQIGLDRRQIVIGGTHTGGPSVIPTNYRKPVDSDYLQRLLGILVDLAGELAAGLVPVQAAVSMGQVAIGYNRRSCYADGSHEMKPAEAGAAPFTGLEGPSDPAQLGVFLRDPAGKLVAVLHQNTCHPCSFYGADFYSADFPGYARRLLREAITPNLPVLFFNGAFGDQGQTKRTLPRVAEPQERQLIRCGLQLAGETLRLLHEAEFRDDLPLATAYRELDAQVLLPDAERLSRARATLARVDAGEDVPPFDIVRAHGAALLQARFGDAPREAIPMHAMRLGPAAIVTQGAELFCQFGLDIKRRSPFPITGVFSICDGYRGYCPTYEAVLGGGYSGEPIYWTRFAPATGYQIVDTACEMLHALHRGDTDA